MSQELEGYTDRVVISFIDLYPKVRRNFPEAKEVSPEERIILGKEIIRIASEHGMTVRPCAEGDALAAYGADCSGCMKISDYEKAIGKRLVVPLRKGARSECAWCLQFLQTSVQILLCKCRSGKDYWKQPFPRPRLSFSARLLYKWRHNP